MPMVSMHDCPAGGGMPGMTAGDWLVSVGLDTAKAVRPKATTLNDVRRKQGRQTVSGSRTHLQRGLGGIKQVSCTCLHLDMDDLDTTLGCWRETHRVRMPELAFS